MASSGSPEGQRPRRDSAAEAAQRAATRGNSAKQKRLIGEGRFRRLQALAATLSTFVGIAIPSGSVIKPTSGTPPSASQVVTGSHDQSANGQRIIIRAHGAGEHHNDRHRETPDAPDGPELPGSDGAEREQNNNAQRNPFVRAADERAAVSAVPSLLHTPGSSYAGSVRLAPPAKNAIPHGLVASSHAAIRSTASPAEWSLPSRSISAATETRDRSTLSNVKPQPALNPSEAAFQLRSMVKTDQRATWATFSDYQAVMHDLLKDRPDVAKQAQSVLNESSRRLTEAYRPASEAIHGWRASVKADGTALDGNGGLRNSSSLEHGFAATGKEVTTIFKDCHDQITKTLGGALGDDKAASNLLGPAPEVTSGLTGSLATAGKDLGRGSSLSGPSLDLRG